MNLRFSAHLKLRHITCFLAVARHRHIGRASDELHLTQPAVSKTLSELDDLVGTRLFDRGRHGATLTVAGEQFLRRAREVSEALVQLESTARTLAGGDPLPHTTLRIGALPTVATGVLPAAIVGFRRTHPEVDISVVTDTNSALCDALLSGRCHCAFARMPDPHGESSSGGMTFEFLYAESLAFAVRPAHPLGGRTHVGVADLARHPMIVSPEQTVPRGHTENLMRAAGLAVPHGHVETLSVSVARAVTMSSDSVWAIPERTIAVDVAHGELAALPVATAGTEEPVGILRAVQQPHEPLVDEFVAQVRERIDDDQD